VVQALWVASPVDGCIALPGRRAHRPLLPDRRLEALPISPPDPAAQVDTAAAKGGRLRRWLGVALALAILAGLALVLDLGRVARLLGRLHARDLAAVLLLKTGDRLLMAWKWWLLLRALGLLAPFAAVLRIYYQGTIVALALPVGVGGDVLRGYWVAQITGRPLAVYASVVMEKLIGLLASASWAILGAAVFTWLALPPLRPLALVLGAASLLALNFGFFLSVRPAVHRRLQGLLAGGGAGEGLLLRPRRLLERAYAAYAAFGERRKALAWNLLLSLAEQGLQMAILLLIARSLGIATATVPLLALMGLHTFVYRIPIASGGWGTNELSAIAIYALAGIDAETAFTLGLVGNVTSLLAALPGLPLLLLDRRRPAPAAPGR
jgi:glycosyltransferase 2 family protein